MIQSLPFPSFILGKDHNKIVYRLYIRQHEITIKNFPKDFVSFGKYNHAYFIFIFSSPQIAASSYKNAFAKADAFAALFDLLRVFQEKTQTAVSGIFPHTGHNSPFLFW